MLKYGFETIGNATLIAYDQGKPVLATDPWITSSAYFGSWGITHQIPEAQLEAIKKASYVWFSHGHPDHLNSDSLPHFKHAKILIGDHVGGRISKGLIADGYSVQVMEDRKWYQLSEHVRALCMVDPYQDSYLLLDINGRLVINTNDAMEFGRLPFVRKLTRQFPMSILLSITGWGSADMSHFFKEDGTFVETAELVDRSPIGATNARKTERFGAKRFIPFACFHYYQRTDSAWANKYLATLNDLYTGFSSPSCEGLPAFVSYDCETDTVTELSPKENPLVLNEPAAFGDDWKTPLDAQEVKRLENYFNAIEHLRQSLDFVAFKVGGVEHEIRWHRNTFNKGLTFEVPKQSLMTCIDYEVFDDLLIGNFMRTTLHGQWTEPFLYPDFAPYIGKYADNGRAKTEKEVAVYFKEYEGRSMDYWMRRRKQAFERFVVSHFSHESWFYCFGRALYRRLLFRPS